MKRLGVLLIGVLFVGLSPLFFSISPPAIDAAHDNENWYEPWCSQGELCSWFVAESSNGGASGFELIGILDQLPSDYSTSPGWVADYEGTCIRFSNGSQNDDIINFQLEAIQINDCSFVSLFEGALTISSWYDSNNLGNRQPPIDTQEFEDHIWASRDVISSITVTADLCEPGIVNVSHIGAIRPVFVDGSLEVLADQSGYSLPNNCTGAAPGNGGIADLEVRGRWISQAEVEITLPDSAGGGTRLYRDFNIGNGVGNGDNTYSYENSDCAPDAETGPSILNDFQNSRIDPPSSHTASNAANINYLRQANCTDTAGSNVVSNIPTSANSRIVYLYEDAGALRRADYFSGQGDESNWHFVSDYVNDASNAYLVSELGFAEADLFFRASEAGDDCQDFIVVDSSGEEGILYELRDGSGALQLNGTVLNNNCDNVSSSAFRVGNHALRSNAHTAILGPGGTDSGAAQPTCESSVGALGWFLCPVSDTLLDVLDGIIGDKVVSNILSFNSLEDGSNQQEALNVVWSGFRTIANVGFVIAFFVVVYSAASGGFLSAYDVKKLIPKLLIGAMLVQLSFFICIQLVGLFNAFGAGIVDIMLAPIPDTGSGIDAAFGGGEGITNGFENAINGVVATLVLILIIIGLVFSITGVFLMIVVFILRNMALVVLTVISPLAFVTWILPNTEGLFKKWWGFYIQLLAVFPIAMAFLASGRLVAYVWSSGGGSANWANQWIAMIALFAPYLLAPKMFSFAGGALSGIVKGVENAKNTMKERGGKVAQTRIGQRVRSGNTFKGNNAVTRGINRASRVATNPTSAMPTKGGSRRRAQAEQGYQKILGEDEQAARVNMDKKRAQERAKGMKAAQKVATGKGQTLSENQLQAAGDGAEIKYLSDVIGKDSRASEQEKAAAVNRLLAVHSTDGTAVKSIGDYMTGLSQSTDVAEANQRGRIIEENKGYAGEVPQLFKPNSRGTVQAMDIRQLNALKAGSIQSFMSDPGAADALIKTQLAGLTSSADRGSVKDAALVNMYKRADAAQKAQLQSTGLTFGTNPDGSVSVDKSAVAVTT